MNVTPSFSGESLLYDIFWNFASKKSSAVFQKQVCFLLPQLAEARHPRNNYRTNKTMEGLSLIQSSFILTFVHLHFFYHCIELIYKTFLKAGQQNCKSLNWRWVVASICSSLREEMLKFFLTGFYCKNNCSITNHGTCQWWQLLQATKCTWSQSWSAICQGDDTTVAFQPMGIFRFWKISFFSQRCLQPLYFSWTQPTTQSLYTGIQFPHDSICASNNQVKIWENRIYSLTVYNKNMYIRNSSYQNCV